MAAPKVSLSALVSRMCIGMPAAWDQSSIILSKSVIGWRTSIIRIKPLRHSRLPR
ncbi:hypothetical protein D3C84_1147660 [compost metagenome]